LLEIEATKLDQESYLIWPERESCLLLSY